MQTTKVDGKNKKNKVFLYTLSTCGWCKKTKELLKEKEIAYEYLDLDQADKENQKAAVEELKAKNLPIGFPIIMINEDKVIQGYKRDEILEALEL